MQILYFFKDIVDLTLWGDWSTSEPKQLVPILSSSFGFSIWTW